MSKAKRFYHFIKEKAAATAVESGFVLSLGFIICLGFVDLIRLYAVMNSLETTAQYAGNYYITEGNQNLATTTSAAQDHLIWFAKDCLSLSVETAGSASLPLYKVTASCEWAPLTLSLFGDFEMIAVSYKGRSA